MDTDLIIALAVATILSTIKSTKSKAKLKAAMLKVFTAIRNAYAGDPDFE